MWCHLWDIYIFYLPMPTGLARKEILAWNPLLLCHTAIPMMLYYLPEKGELPCAIKPGLISPVWSIQSCPEPGNTPLVSGYKWRLEIYLQSILTFLIYSRTSSVVTHHCICKNHVIRLHCVKDQLWCILWYMLQSYSLQSTATIVILLSNCILYTSYNITMS